MTEAAAPPLVSGLLNRDTDTRMSEQALDAAWGEPTTRVLRVRAGRVAVGELPDGGWELDLKPAVAVRSDAHLYLGRTEHGALFAIEEDEAEVLSESPREWQYPLLIGDRLDPVHQEVLAVTFALTNWHRSAAFSPADGEPTTPIQGGWARVDSHGREHFPRTDPAVIVLVEHENRLLLGSNVLWESGRFSLLAGFIEAGESAEQTVVREVFEEAGVRVHNVRYVASQSWPFPRSIMLGFRASLVAGSDPEALVAEAAEISELRWFTREELREPQPGLLLPMHLSIARWLIDLWIAEGDSEH
jgi:NAD+ diphosphatase